MSYSHSFISIFNRAIADYHVYDDVDRVIDNPYESRPDNLLYKKCWIDTVQWHLEDIIRDPEISAEKALRIKRRIDKSNQDRTDIVEHLDDYILSEIATKNIAINAKLNTESPAWAIDRLSILCLKIYHMQEEVNRKEAGAEHKNKCQQKLDTLSDQQHDLSTAIDQLLFDIKAGNVQMKLYRQMKMYNDPNLNPVLYKVEN